MDRETVRATIANAAQTFDTIQVRVETKRQTRADAQAEWNEELDAATDAILSAMPAPVVDRAKVRALIESVMSPDYLGSEELDQTTDYICASFTTRDDVERETIEALAILFERGTLTEENSIQGDVPGVIRAQDSASLALLRSHRGSES